MKGEHSKATSYGQTTSTKSSNPVAFSKQGAKPANSNVATADKTKRQPSNKRRTGDGRLFAQMTGSQLRAAERIALGFKLRTAGLGFRTQSFSRQPTAMGNTGARHLELMQEFMGWAVKTQELGRAFTPLGELNVPRSFKGVGAGRVLEDVPADITTLTGKDLRPYAPVQIAALRISGAIDLSWQRRTRVGGGPLNGIVPLSEAYERYELEFIFNGSSRSKYVSDRTSYRYELAEFNTDFDANLTDIPALSLNLYHLSETIGRGYPATENI